MERARARDGLALAELHDRYAEPIKRYRYISDSAHAEDLTGDVCPRQLQVLPTCRAPEATICRAGCTGWPMAWPSIGSDAEERPRSHRWKRLSRQVRRRYRW